MLVADQPDPGGYGLDVDVDAAAGRAVVGGVGQQFGEDDREGLDGSVEGFHGAVDALERDTVPYTYYLKVLAGRDQPPAERPHGGPER